MYTYADAQIRELTRLIVLDGKTVQMIRDIHSNVMWLPDEVLERAPAELHALLEKQVKIKAAIQARCRPDGERLPEGTFVTSEGLKDAALVSGDFHSLLGSC